MDLIWLIALMIGGGIGFFIRSLIRPKHKPVVTVVNDVNVTNTSKGTLEIEKLADILDDFKMVLIVRNDLKMGKGKIAAQCSHATLGLYKKLVRRAPKALDCWEYCAQPKAVVKIDGEDEMLELQERAKSLKLPTHITIDAGRTQIAPNSRTVMAILGPVEVVDAVTGHVHVIDSSKHMLGLGYQNKTNIENVKKAAGIHYNGQSKSWLEMGFEHLRPFWTKYVNYCHILE